MSIKGKKKVWLKSNLVWTTSCLASTDLSRTDVAQKNTALFADRFVASQMLEIGRVCLDRPRLHYVGTRCHGSLKQNLRHVLSTHWTGQVPANQSLSETTFHENVTTWSLNRYGVRLVLTIVEAF